MEELSGIPIELKTIEVDVEKKIFNVNGVPFGENCTAFSISCRACYGYEIRMDIVRMDTGTTVHLASYSEDGEKEAGCTYELQPASGTK